MALSSLLYQVACSDVSLQYVLCFVERCRTLLHKGIKQMKININRLKRIGISSMAVAFMAVVIGYAPLAMADCAGVPTAILSCPSQFDGSGGIEKSGLMGILTVVVNIMAAIVGIVAIGAFVYAGILYASAGDSQEQVKKARDIIRNTVIGIVLFVALYSIANFIVPGGVI